MSDDGSEPKYFATKKYKDWVRTEIGNRKWTYKVFAAEVTRRGMKCTVQALQQFLGKEDEVPVPSNTTLMPGINKALGLPVPKHFDPTTPLSRLHLALDASWDELPAHIQQSLTLMITGEDPAKKPGQ